MSQMNASVILISHWMSFFFFLKLSNIFLSNFKLFRNALFEWQDQQFIFQRSCCNKHVLHVFLNLWESESTVILSCQFLLGLCLYVTVTSRIHMFISLKVTYFWYLVSYRPKYLKTFSPTAVFLWSSVGESDSYLSISITHSFS